MRNDGLGAQFQAIIYTAIFAEFNNLKYVYTPFKLMEHNYNNEQDYLSKKEKLVNFKNNFLIADERIKIKKMGAPYAIDFFEENIKKCSNSKALKHIKKVFRANKPKDFFNNNKFNIAIHIRRPNPHDYRLAGADVSDQEFIDIINYLQQLYSIKDHVIHIYSQGDIENFKIYVKENVVLHLNEEIEATFTGMVFADVLVLSPSALSYTAGLLSYGEVYYYKNYWHPPLEHWKTYGG